jgi:hypothetical protein
MSFQEYYRYYLTLHQNRWNRLLHAAGQLATVAYVVAMIASGKWLLLPAAPLVVYPFAWSGHFFFEKNRPAAWSRPLWAKACDWVMLKDMILRRL